MKIRPSFLFTIALFSILSACDKPKPEEPEVTVRPVKIFIPGDSLSFEKHRFPAVVDALKKADLSFRVSGKIAKINVKEGDNIPTGTVLAELDRADFEIQLSSAKAEFSRTKADYDRAALLVDKGHVSRTDFDRLEALYRIAESNFMAAEKNLAYTELKAPFSGTVARRYLENFEDVNAMQAIFSLQDVSRLAIKVNIPESIMIRSDRERNPPKIHAEFENIPGESFPLAISEMSTQADAQSGTYLVTLVMDAPQNHNILPGMSAIVTGQRDIAANSNGEDNQTFLVPPIAVVEDSTGRFVFLAEKSSEGRFHVVKRRVESGLLFQSGLEVISGLNRGDRVIVAGVSQMREGLEVKIIGESSL